MTWLTAVVNFVQKTVLERQISLRCHHQFTLPRKSYHRGNYCVKPNRIFYLFFGHMASSSLGFRLMLLSSLYLVQQAGIISRRPEYPGELPDPRANTGMVLALRREPVPPCDPWHTTLGWSLNFLPKIQAERWLSLQLQVHLAGN